MKEQIILGLTTALVVTIIVGTFAMAGLGIYAVLADRHPVESSTQNASPVPQTDKQLTELQRQVTELRKVVGELQQRESRQQQDIDYTKGLLDNFLGLEASSNGTIDEGTVGRCGEVR